MSRLVRRISSGRLASRLQTVEKRLRPTAPAGIRSVLLTVPRSELSALGEPCSEHPDCCVRWTGLIATHFLGADLYQP